MISVTMKARVIFVAKLIAFCLGVYLSAPHAADHWYIGPIFGLVVLIWYLKSLKNLFDIRCAAFLIASTLIYALVVQIYEPKILHGSDNLMFAVAVGTICLPMAHALFLRTSWKRALIAIAGVYLLWWIVSLVVDKLNLYGSPIETLINPISVWQGAYLLFMFAPVPKPLKNA